MASITSLMGGTSSTNSLYGTRNVLSGLASGMDTESMIQNAVSGYNLKISNLRQDYTMLEWEQTALRSIINKMAGFSNKYMSYTSSTNLLSQSFFKNAVSISTAGDFKDKVSATGKSSSEVKVLGVKQLATAASYSVSGIAGSGDEAAIEGKKVDLQEQYKQSKLAGSMTFKYDNASVSISFSADELVESGEELANKINEKLADKDMTVRGSSAAASTYIEAKYENGKITLVDKKAAGSRVWVSGATGDIKGTLGIESRSAYETGAEAITVDTSKLVDTSKTYAQRLAAQKLTFTVDGVTKSFTLDGVGDATSMDQVQKALQEELDTAFGEGKVTAELDPATEGLVFTTQKGSTMTIKNGQALGLASGEETSYVNTSKTLGSVLGEDVWKGLTAVGKDADGNEQYEFKINDETLKFTKKSTVKEVMDAINESGAGVTVTYSGTTNQFRFTANDTGVAGRVELGEGLARSLFGDPQAEGADYKAGQDAIVSMEVNGVELTDVSRSSNTFTVDGMSISLKGTFNYEEVELTEATGVEGQGVYNAPKEATVINSLGNEVTAKYVDKDGYYVNAKGQYYMTSYDGKGEKIKAETNLLTANAAEKAVTFTASSDADTIVDAVKAMVEDYNAMVTEIKKAYSTMPLQDSSGDRYKPLTDEDRAGMTESAIESYEEKAKTGLLFADRDLNNAYQGLYNAIANNSSALRAIGIDLSYEDGITTMTVDESKMRSTLEADPDAVQKVFAGSDGKSGIMGAMETTVEKYAKTTGATKGILVNRAGSPLSATSLLSNELQSDMDKINEQIEKWQDKLANQVDYYTSKFTALEQLILQMNSQSSALAGLGGGY